MYIWKIAERTFRRPIQKQGFHDKPEEKEKKNRTLQQIYHFVSSLESLLVLWRSLYLKRNPIQKLLLPPFLHVRWYFKCKCFIRSSSEFDFLYLGFPAQPLTIIFLSMATLNYDNFFLSTSYFKRHSFLSLIRLNLPLNLIFCWYKLFSLKTTHPSKLVL